MVHGTSDTRRVPACVRRLRPAATGRPGNRVLMVSGTDEPHRLPEVDAPFASGESVVSFQRPSIAGGAQPFGQRTRPADAAPEPGAAPLRLTGSYSVRIS